MKRLVHIGNERKGLNWVQAMARAHTMMCFHRDIYSGHQLIALRPLRVAHHRRLGLSFRVLAGHEPIHAIGNILFRVSARERQPFALDGYSGLVADRYAQVWSPHFLSALLPCQHCRRRLHPFQSNRQHTEIGCGANNVLNAAIQLNGAVGFAIIESDPMLSGPHTNRRVEHAVDHGIKVSGNISLQKWGYRAIHSSYRSKSAHYLSSISAYATLGCTVAMWPRISPASARALLTVQYRDSFGFTT